MSHQSEMRFTFDVSSQAVAFDVVSFKLEEKLSCITRLELELASREANVDFGAILDQPATFTIWQGAKAARYVHGLVSELVQGDTGFRRTRYRLVLEPQLARAQLSSNWRIFQHLSLPQILATMLKEMGVTHHEMRLEAPHLTREYCAQAGGETHLEFLERAGAEEGLIYYFSYTENQHTVVFADSISAAGTVADIARPVVYQPDRAGLAGAPCLWKLHYHERVRTARQIQRDRASWNPAYDHEQRAEGAYLDHQQRQYERFDFPGRYKSADAGKPYTATRIHALRHDVRVAQVTGDDTRLLPGLAFELVGHAREDINGRWRTVSMVHHGHQPTSLEEDAADSAQGTQYYYEAELVPAHQEWKAPLRSKPRIDGPHVATVTGPPGEEIYCDEMGRIKLQFPWDREGQYNEFSSCWVRVSQAWAGAGMGGLSLPRIGQEVIVDFIDGDPDQPIVVGRAYNALNPPPVKLPDNKTQMSIKSQTHKGKGYNELSFDDADGKQAFTMHAQKDMHRTVLGDSNSSVHGNDTDNVTGTRTVKVTGAVNETYDAGQTLTIGAGGYAETITGDFTTTLTGNYVSRREGTWEEVVTQTSSRTVDGAVTETLHAGRTVNITQGGDVRSVVGDIEDSNKGQRLIAVEGAMAQSVTETFSAFSQQMMTQGSATEFVAHVGEDGAFLRITPGEIVLNAGGAEVKINADGVTINGDIIRLN